MSHLIRDFGTPILVAVSLRTYRPLATTAWQTNTAKLVDGKHEEPMRGTSTSYQWTRPAIVLFLDRTPSERGFVSDLHCREVSPVIRKAS